MLWFIICYFKIILFYALFLFIQHLIFLFFLQRYTFFNISSYFLNFAENNSIWDTYFPPSSSLLPSSFLPAQPKRKWLSMKKQLWNSFTNTCRSVTAWIIPKTITANASTMPSSPNRKQIVLKMDEDYNLCIKIKSTKNDEWMT